MAYKYRKRRCDCPVCGRDIPAYRLKSGVWKVRRHKSWFPEGWCSGSGQEVQILRPSLVAEPEVGPEGESDAT